MAAFAGSNHGGEQLRPNAGLLEPMQHVMCTTRPFHVRCSRVECPGFNLSQGHADPESALAEWNSRVQPSPKQPNKAADLFGFTKKNLIRGEMVCMTLDRTGVLTSEEIAFSPDSRPLDLRPRDE